MLVFLSLFLVHLPCCHSGPSVSSPRVLELGFPAAAQESSPAKPGWTWDTSEPPQLWACSPERGSADLKDAFETTDSAPKWGTFGRYLDLKNLREGLNILNASFVYFFDGGRMISSSCFKLLAVIFCCSSLTAGKILNTTVEKKNVAWILGSLIHFSEWLHHFCLFFCLTQLFKKALNMNRFILL